MAEEIITCKKKKLKRCWYVWCLLGTVSCALKNVYVYMHTEYCLWKTWFSQAPCMLWLVLQVFHQKSWVWQPWHNADLQNRRPWWDSPNICVNIGRCWDKLNSVWPQYILFVCLISCIKLTLFSLVGEKL